MDRHPQRYIRTNTLKINSKDLKTRLVSKGLSWETCLRRCYCSRKIFVPNWRYYGIFTWVLLHSRSQLLFAVEALDIAKDQTILDMASAPGGKTTFIAQKMQNSGCIIALEPNLRRIKSILYNIARCGVINTCVYKMDGRHVSDLNIKFDRVLLDAPCSGEGVIAKDIKRKTNHTPEDLEYCVLIQTSLIEAPSKLSNLVDC